MLSLAQKWTVSPARELGFALHDVARLLRTYSDQRARELGTTRAQWAVLSRLQRCEGSKQNELAEALDLAPITLGRLIDKLTAAGTRRASRRCNRPTRQSSLSHRKSRPCLRDLGALAEDLMGRALAGIDQSTVNAMHDGLMAVKANIKNELIAGAEFKVIQPKTASGRDPAQDDAATGTPQPLPFTPPKSSLPQAGRESAVAPSSSSSPSSPTQPIQFTPARPGPQAPPAAPPPAAPPAPQTPIVVKRKRGTGRFVMLVVIPLVALALGFGWWLSSGRYVSTDNAYVGANKSLIAPQVTGSIAAVHVVEGQKVKVGDPLFDIDSKPYDIDLALAKGKLEAAKVEFANLQSGFSSNVDQIKMGEDAVKVRQADFDRKNDLAISRSGTAADRDTSMANLIQAKQILEFVKWQQATVKVKLGGGPAYDYRPVPGLYAGQSRGR